MDVQEKGHAIANYTIGGIAIGAPAWMQLLSDATVGLQFLTALGGFILVCYQLRKTYKKDKGD